MIECSNRFQRQTECRGTGLGLTIDRISPNVTAGSLPPKNILNARRISVCASFRNDMACKDAFQLL
jgi:hypothetical protein